MPQFNALDDGERYEAPNGCPFTISCSHGYGKFVCMACSQSGQTNHSFDLLMTIEAAQQLANEHSTKCDAWAKREVK